MWGVRATRRVECDNAMPVTARILAGTRGGMGRAGRPASCNVAGRLTMRSVSDRCTLSATSFTQALEKGTQAESAAYSHSGWVDLLVRVGHDPAAISVPCMPAQPT